MLGGENVNEKVITDNDIEKLAEKCNMDTETFKNNLMSFSILLGETIAQLLETNEFRQLLSSYLQNS